MSQRIVSLIASATEIVCHLGLGDQLVGRSHECDFPSWVSRLPICTRAKLNIEKSSRHIDKQVKDILRDALSVYEVHGPALEKLQPTLIVTQSQCEVCAVSLKDVEKVVCHMVSSRPRIVSLEPNCLADVWQDILKVAEAADVHERGETSVRQLQGRIQSIAEKARAFVVKPTVGCIEWVDPLMAAGNWVPELVGLAGGVNLFGVAGKHSPWMQWEELVKKDPDVIVVMPCGFDIQRTQKEMSALTQRPEWKNLNAVHHGRIYVTDGNQYFNRPGPRLVESLEILAEIFHPHVFEFGHENKGWIYLKSHLKKTKSKEREVAYASKNPSLKRVKSR